MPIGMAALVDKVIERLPAIADDDLMLCEAHGIAYQRDMSHRVTYDDAYFNKCLGYEGKEIANRINVGRIGLVNRYVPMGVVIDVGIGSGEFIKLRPGTLGFDVNPVALEWLRSEGLSEDDLSRAAGVTFWDVIEHVEEPAEYFGKLIAGALLFCSLPIFEDIRRVRESKHYRPGEHLYYWTRQGFIDWMSRHGFLPLERSSFETNAGRECIESFVFRYIGEAARSQALRPI